MISLSQIKSHYSTEKDTLDSMQIHLPAFIYSGFIRNVVDWTDKWQFSFICQVLSLFFVELKSGQMTTIVVDVDIDSVCHFDI